MLNLDFYYCFSILMSEKNGWSIASSIVSLKKGLNWRRLSRKSMPCADIPGYLSWKLERGLGLKVFKYNMAFSSVTKLESSSSGVPSELNILFS